MNHINVKSVVFCQISHNSVSIVGFNILFLFISYFD